MIGRGCAKGHEDIFRSSRTPSEIRYKGQMRARQRLGISPVISSTILIAITVTLGLSLWSFVNSQVNTSTESFASATTDYVNKVSERYVIVSMALGYQDPSLSTCTNVSKCVTIWVYNYSERDVRVTNVHFSDSKDNQFDVEIKDTVLKSKTLDTVTVDLSGSTIQPFSGDGKTVYYATIITDGGATKLYYQTDK